MSETSHHTAGERRSAAPAVIAILLAVGAIALMYFSFVNGVAAALDAGGDGAGICDTDDLELGEGSNLQDNVVVHADPGSPAIIGAGVSVGHGAVIHGCRIEDGCLIGMNATVLNGAVIGAESLVAAGSVVLEGTIIPPRSLVAGVPAKVRRELVDDEVAAMKLNADTYVERGARYAGR
jgi:carbonic anhydrase/acetyltransferase-like protein (isoleucine patch superfamily)